MSYKMNCKFHLVLCPKYRQNILPFTELVDWLLSRYGDHWAFIVEEAKGKYDHIHMTIDIFVTYFPLSKIVNLIKSESSKFIRDEIDCNFNWSKGYYLSSFGDSNSDIINNYINNH